MEIKNKMHFINTITETENVIYVALLISKWLQVCLWRQQIEKHAGLAKVLNKHCVMYTHVHIIDCVTFMASKSSFGGKKKS